jgi:hypothetical protein
VAPVRTTGQNPDFYASSNVVWYCGSFRARNPEVKKKEKKKAN